MFSILSTVPYSKWNDHVLSWWKHREDPNVLFLKYEEMQKVCDCFFKFGQSWTEYRLHEASCLNKISCDKN